MWIENMASGCWALFQESRSEGELRHESLQKKGYPWAFSSDNWLSYLFRAGTEISFLGHGSACNRYLVNIC